MFPVQNPGGRRPVANRASSARPSASGLPSSNSRPHMQIVCGTSRTVPPRAASGCVRPSDGRPRGGDGRSPIGRQRQGWPVKLVMTSMGPIWLGPTIASTCAKAASISPITRRRKRSSCTWSTAERKRALRNALGQASGSCHASSSSRPERVSSSNEAAASAWRMAVSAV